MTQFLNALIDAEGIELDGTPKAEGCGGRSASYRITDQSNDSLLIGSAYKKQLGVNPGKGKGDQEGWNRTSTPFWQRITDIGAQIPEEAWESLPKDMSRNGERYLYGTPNWEVIGEMRSLP